MPTHGAGVVEMGKPDPTTGTKRGGLDCHVKIGDFP